MKIIVSHDVDHLYGSDHYKDLIYPKLWLRETLSLLKKITNAVLALLVVVIVILTTNIV